MREIGGIVIGIMALVLMANACAPSPEGPGGPGAASDLPDSVESAVVAEVSEQTGVSADDVEVVSVQSVEWPDACLGLAEEGEVCAQVITSGWQVSVDAGGQDLTVRTNDDGTQVRIES